MTEDEAKTTDCCGPADCGEAIDTDPTASPLGGAMRRVCRASACMAWRGGIWERIDRAVAMGAPEGSGWIKDGQGSGLGGAVTHRQQWKREQFYCGLAGKP